MWVLLAFLVYRIRNILEGQYAWLPSEEFVHDLWDILPLDCKSTVYTITHLLLKSFKPKLRIKFDLFLISPQGACFWASIKALFNIRVGIGNLFLTNFKTSISYHPCSGKDIVIQNLVLIKSNIGQPVLL